VRLTLLRAKEALAKKSPADDLDYRLNRVCERYILNGKFMGTTARIKLAAPFGQATLPRGFRTIEGVKVAGNVFGIANRWWDFLPGKGSSRAPSLSTVNDLGDGHANMYVPVLLPTAPTTDASLLPDFPAGGTITVAYSGGNDPMVSIQGRDINEMPVSLNFTGAGTQNSVFARISKISKQRNAGVVVVTFTAPNDANYGGAVTTLAVMEAVEEETYYRRYFIPLLAQQATVAVEGFCKRRHLEFTSDADVLPFTNISALGLGLDAYQAESEGDKTLANQFWNDGVAMLNSELGDANAEDQIPAIRFHYPGRTTPRLTSHM